MGFTYTPPPPPAPTPPPPAFNTAGSGLIKVSDTIVAWGGDVTEDVFMRLDGNALDFYDQSGDQITNYRQNLTNLQMSANDQVNEVAVIQVDSGFGFKCSSADAVTENQGSEVSGNSEGLFLKYEILSPPGVKEHLMNPTAGTGIQVNDTIDNLGHVYQVGTGPCVVDNTTGQLYKIVVNVGVLSITAV